MLLEAPACYHAYGGGACMMLTGAEAHVEAQVELNATQIRIILVYARNPLSTKEIVVLLGGNFQNAGNVWKN